MYKIDVRAGLPNPKIPKHDRESIFKKIEALMNDPRPRWCEKLSGNDSFRISIGNYRVLYTVDDDEKKIFVHAIGHRKDIYREC